MLLTKQGGFIIKPIATVLGAILNLIYEVLDKIGIVNIGISIILFTLFVRLLLVPLMFKQNKSSKIMNYIQPELNKVVKKYKGKKDQESMLAQQRETKEIQDKYGAGMTMGCLTSFIQFPIFIALYRVIQNIPAYVGKVYDLYSPIAKAIMGNDKAIENLNAIMSNKNYSSSFSAVKLDTGNVDTIVDVLAKFPKSAWTEFQSMFGANDAVVTAMSGNVDTINHIYNFGGIDLTTAPGWAFSIALAIPILSMVFQYLSMSINPQQNSADPTQQATMKSMNMMMKIMPLFSFFICMGVPCGVGLYWAVGSLVSFLTTLLINVYYKHCDMEKVVEKSKEKAAKKLAKKKAKGKKSFMDKLQEAAMGVNPEEEAKSATNKVAGTSLKNYNSNTMNNNAGQTTQYRKGSLAAKANALQRYNDNEGGKN